MQKTNIGFRYGLIAGLAMIVAYLGLFFFAPDLLFRRMGLLAFAILLVVMIGAGGSAKRQFGEEELLFRELVRPIFTVFVVSMMLVMLVHYIVYNFLDFNMEQITKEWFIGEAKRQMELANQSPELVEKELQILENGDYSYGIFKAMQTYVLSLVFGFLMAASIAVGLMYARLFGKR
ncbi:MAG: DUF4199 domain-containing protein [Chitinophagales bacterium]